MLNHKREQAYKNIEERIGNTLLEEYKGSVPNSNRILIKRECDNPFGSHYDRVYIALFRHFEELGKIKPGDKVLETTSGAAGVSFAGIGKLLGYDCYVALPAGGEKARENAIKEQLPNENNLILTPAEDYISGFPKFLKGFLAGNKDYFFLNHSMGPRNSETGLYMNNETTLNSLKGIARESIGKIGNIHFFIPAVGNGSSVLGPGRVFNFFNSLITNFVGEALGDFSMAPKMRRIMEEADSCYTNIVPFETFQSAAAYDKLNPGEYEQRFGIKPGSLSRHRLPGTSYQGISFPHIRSAIEDLFLRQVILVSDEKMDSEYRNMTGRTDTKDLPHWDTSDIIKNGFGRTTRAGIAVALKIAEETANKNFLVIAYDKAERYDS